MSNRCYSLTLHLGGEDQSVQSYLWHDIAYCYNLQAKIADAEEAAKLRRLALLSAKKSVSLCSKVWEHWNLLGVIALAKGMARDFAIGNGFGYGKKK